MPDPADRRVSDRFAINTDTTCSFISPVLEDFGPVRIKNISMEGIALILSERVDPGVLLAITLSNPAKSFTKTVMVRVVHSQANLGTYLLGGTFTMPLTYQELTTLVM